MRRIEFRAWDLVTEKLYHVNSIDFKNNHIQLQDDDGTITALLDEVYLTQYTGLTTNSGNKIYEGDIIQTKRMSYNIHGSYEGMKNVVGRVIYSENTGQYLLKCDEEGSNNIIFGMNYHKIIGNIFENPEL